MKRNAKKARGFTLIEMMAVVMIIGIIFTFFVPNLAAFRDDDLKDQAVEIAESLELARQRAIMTGKTHRVWIDLQEGQYAVEWLVSDAEAGIEDDDDADVAVADPGDPSRPGDPAPGGKAEPIEMRPPRHALREFRPVPGRAFGQTKSLGPDFYFVGLDHVDGWTESGSVQITFDEYGTTTWAELKIADGWDNQISIIVEPVLDRARLVLARDQSS